jgi:protein-tyrosine phosphatase
MTIAGPVKMELLLKILFVCLGNICRSPAAEGVMRQKIRQNNLENRVELDSAGTSGNHVGEAPDERMQRHARKRGIELRTLRGRKFTVEDFEKFDLIVAMDDDNFTNILKLDSKSQYRSKVFKMVSFLQSRSDKMVPDPYYGGPEGFEEVLDILEDGFQGLLCKIQEEM